jgi:two-component system sensor histidine kinase YesM
MKHSLQSLFSALHSYFLRISIKTKLIIATFFVLLVPITIICTLLYKYAYDLFESHEMNYKYNIIQLMQDKIDNYINQVDLATYTFYQPEVQQMLTHPNQNNYSDAAFDEKLSSFFITNTNFTDVAGSYDNVIFIGSGNRVYQSGYYIVNSYFPFKEANWYRQAVSSQGETIIHFPNDRPYLVIPSNELSISFVRKINSVFGDGDLGALLIDVPVSQIEKLFNNFKLQEDDNIYIIDQTGTIIYNNQDSNLVGSKLAEEYNAVLDDSSDGKQVYFTGKERILATYFPSSKSSWKIVSLDRMSTLELTLQSLRNRAILLASLCLFLGIAMTFLLSARIMRGITYLRNKMDQFEEGDLRSVIEWRRNDEIGKLANSYNQLIKRIDDLIKENYISQIQEQEAKIMALQAQINPHFLYNSLDSISSIAMINHVPLISDFSNRLAELLRYSISKKGPIVTLQDELNHIETYLSIMNIRYENKFEVSWEIHPKTLTLPIFKLTLQPIVENAVYHGLEMKLGKGSLHIATTMELHRYTVHITDDGLGIPLVKLAELQHKLTSPLQVNDQQEPTSNSLGLINVHERIRMRFGKNYGLAIESTKGRTTVTITLPTLYQTKQPEP